MRFFILKDRQAVSATQKEWSAFLVSPDRFVGQWTFADGTVYVSTVFLGIDHNFSGVGPPLLFETMVFGGPMNGHQERTATWAEAEQTHERVCAQVTKRVLQ